VSAGDGSGPGPLWCRLETEGTRVRRVNVMHASGEILLSWPPERFEAAVLARMRAGQVRAVFAERADGRWIELADGTGPVFHAERIP
jgi:hypothetical protein